MSSGSLSREHPLYCTSSIVSCVAASVVFGLTGASVCNTVFNSARRPTYFGIVGEEKEARRSCHRAGANRVLSSTTPQKKIPQSPVTMSTLEADAILPRRPHTPTTPPARPPCQAHESEIDINAEQRHFPSRSSDELSTSSLSSLLLPRYSHKASSNIPN
ncbi:hypothetical protein B0H16DRAFT_1480925 [Mycena metata]|uniref:Uncharacterized protein n=1 Tax=Mycena metata TaxID=1033252 RepID=A0AAD7H0T7_9AGAR|nr:hypothetical protein B0H16DRAFT_1480925 [Mycena metata]